MHLPIGLSLIQHLSELVLTLYDGARNGNGRMTPELNKEMDARV